MKRWFRRIFLFVRTTIIRCTSETWVVRALDVGHHSPCIGSLPKGSVLLRTSGLATWRDMIVDVPFMYGLPRTFSL